MVGEQVSPEQVTAWIKSGQLRAIDLAKPGAKRPRYRIAVEDLAAFESRHAVSGPAATVSRPRRDDSVTAYY